MKEAIKSGTQILFDSDKVQRYGFIIPEDTTSAGAEDDDAKFYLGTNGENERIPDHRRFDVAAPSHIALYSSWWPLELLPVLERKQANSGKWVLQPRFVSFPKLHF